jgi:hypothetical protein
VSRDLLFGPFSVPSNNYEPRAYKVQTPLTSFTLLCIRIFLGSFKQLQTLSQQSPDTFMSFTTKRPQTPLSVFASSKHCSHHIILNRVFIANSLEKRNLSWIYPAGCREADLVLSTSCSHPSPRIKARGMLGGRNGNVSNLRKFSLEGYYHPTVSTIVLCLGLIPLSRYTHRELKFKDTTATTFNNRPAAQNSFPLVSGSM